jgi:REP element-mobilizing transposase RayT
MPSTHVCLHYHIVFTTKARRACIKEPWQERLYSYLGGILRGLKGVAEEIGGVSDHVHLLVSLGASHRLADVIRDLKSSSSKWVHEVVGIPFFGWQDGYGAFSVGASEVGAIRKYIQEQKDHRRRKSFQEEYRNLLLDSGIEFDERFLW